MRFFSVALFIIILCKCKTSESENGREYIQDNKETAQNDNNCTAILSDLQTVSDSSSGELTVTWESNTLEECSFQYRTKITEISQAHASMQSPFINTTSYLFTNIKPCTIYNVTVELFQNDDPNVLANISDTAETETAAFNQIENLNISTTTNTISLSWTAHKYADICNVHYNIIINDEIPYFRYVNSTEHFKDHLQSCTEYNVSVTPSSVPRNKFDNVIPYLVHTVSTLPEKVSNLSLVHNGSTTISWIPPDNNKCIKKYRITKRFNGTTSFENVTNTHFESGDNLYCTEVEIEAVTSDGHLGAAVRILKPGPVKNLEGTPTDTSIFVQWEIPTNGSCVADYSIELSGQSSITTEFQNHTFDKLIPCTEYKIKVIARSLDGTPGDEESIQRTTLEPKVIGPIENLDFTLQEDSVNVIWVAPLNAENCSVTYKLLVYDSEDNEIDNESTTETFYEIDSTLWKGCTNYTISVTPILSTEGSTTEKIIAVPKVTNPPNCTKIKVEQTWAVLECEVDDYEINMCAVQEVIIDCEASELENNNGSWIKWNAVGSETTEYDSRCLNVTVENISAFTNYSCTGIVLNVAGNSSTSEPVEIRTPEGVPNAPELYEITARNKSLHINWREPEVLPGILQNYYITIESDGPWYFAPADDECRLRGNKTYEYEITEPPWNEYDFVDAYPGYKYRVYINASTNAGYGPQSEKQTQTLAGTPEEPRSVNYNVSSLTTEGYNANVSVTWIFPCYTNGDLKKFAIDVFGIPLVDKDKDNDTRKNLPVKLNEQPENLNYEYIITELQPAFNYIVYVKAVPTENLESGKTKLEFCSPESYPEAPFLKPISEVTENTFTLEWDEPPRKNGVLQYYNITVVNEGSLYWVPTDKACSKDFRNHTFTILPEETSFTFGNGVPHHKYNAFISASTSIGSGPPSETIVTQTSESEPEPVRNFKKIIRDPLHEEYSALVEFSFDHPCNTYGPLKQFPVILHGNRLNYSPHYKRLDVTNELEREQYQFSQKLRAEYEYILIVQVETHSDKSKISEKKFKSPSGVPPAVTRTIAAPVAHGSTQANFTFDLELFDEIYGEILYYALILGENNYEEKSLFGFWEGTNETWPSLDNDFDEGKIQSYQATPNFWNPFKECGCDNYTFILGNVDYSEFNKPLRVGVNYTIKVRGFTQYGYRDSPTVTFQIPAVLNLALILGLTFGILGTGILLGFIFILWKKRRQWDTKKESIKSIPLTPIPISVKQFPKFYSELKDNNDKLKQEFALLSSKSNEVILPSYDGLLPENKKKNRYTNIIPYDQTRVKLLDSNDNYSGSDYINASYIQGYSGNIEYIATQGPLEQTCLDFWKMVIQENSTLIVMVAQFVEQNKDKCYKYFPNNHENMELENGIAVRCCTELNFNTHVVRTLLVQKDLQQLTVTHLQFTDWPDFGCPMGTDVILEFCQLMREHAEKSPDPIIIHCSAGVGRTGTLIAVDIILQAINRKRDIDIFGTVLNLRRDRKNMVQTEKQYLYIHDCINDAIQNPAPTHCADISKEPIYENVDDIKKNHSDNNIVESKF